MCYRDDVSQDGLKSLYGERLLPHLPEPRRSNFITTLKDNLPPIILASQTTRPVELSIQALTRSYVKQGFLA